MLNGQIKGRKSPAMTVMFILETGRAVAVFSIEVGIKIVSSPGGAYLEDPGIGFH